MTAVEVTRHLGFSASKLSRIETGSRSVSDDDVRSLAALYRLPSAEQDRLLHLAEESRTPGWWEKFDLPYADFVGLEATASTIQDYTTVTVPALLQSADYARAVASGHNPHASPSIIQQRVTAKMIRQQVLARADPPDLFLVFDEAVLHRVVGGVDSWRSQLLHIVESADRYPIDVRVIPFDAGWHPGMDFSFTIMSFTEAIRDVVYRESLNDEAYMDDPRELEIYRTAFAAMTAFALDFAETLTLIKKIAKKWRSPAGPMAGNQPSS